MTPDIRDVSKGITSGWVPMGAVVVSKASADHFETRPLPLHLTQFGHRVCTAAGVVAIEAYREEKLVGNTKVLGTILKEGLEGPMARLRGVCDMLCIRFSTSSTEADRSVGVSCAQRAFCGCDELCRNR